MADLNNMGFNIEFDLSDLSVDKYKNKNCEKVVTYKPY
jgi:hypothetical protein